MGGLGEGRHVMQAAGAVVHLGEHQHGQIGIEVLGDFFGLDEHQAHAVLARQAFSDVEIGGEVAALGNDEPSRGAVGLDDAQRGAQHLEEIHRRAVGDHELVLASAHQPRDLVAHALRQVDPAGGVPAADQALAPFFGHHLLHACGGGAGHHAE
jgi:hypothetical protein